MSIVMQRDKINIIGAYEHNLKNIDVSFYKYKINVVTGLSGSGKSSLVFDTLYTQGQKVLLDSLSISGKHLIESSKDVKVKRIENLSTVISVSQKAISKNSRSILATILGLYSYFRVLYSTYGSVFSPETQEKITIHSIHKIKVLLHQLHKDNYKFTISIFDKVSHKIQHYKTNTVLSHQKYKDFLNINNLFETYIYISDHLTDKDLDIIIEKIFSINNGFLVFKCTKEVFDKNKELFTRFRFYSYKDEVFVPITYKAKCLKSNFFIDRISPSLFSFNTKIGMCSQCDGTGIAKVFSPFLIVLNQNLSLNQNALSPWSIKSSTFYDTLLSLSLHFNFSLDTPFKNLSDKVKNVLFYGTSEKIEFIYNIDGKERRSYSTFGGVIFSLEEKLKKLDSISIQEDLFKYMQEGKCTFCSGYRINKDVQNIKILDKHIGEVLEMDLNNLLNFLEEVGKIFDRRCAAIIDNIIYKVLKLKELDIDYLSLDRRVNSLSSGELQRVKLVNQLFSGLVDMIYVLDEPCIGLHDHDKIKVINILESIKQNGNTIIAVEHDGNILEYADYIVDIGPYAGHHGGELVATGNFEDIKNNDNSITGKYLSKKLKLYRPENSKDLTKLNKISLYGASGFNLKNIDLELYEKSINVITGVSGSGKSTLINKTLYSALKNYLDPKNCAAGYIFKDFKGFDLVDRVIKIDQTAICRTPKSNPAIYIGLFTKIRDFFVSLDAAKDNKMTASMFSFNVAGGRCEYCKGDGYHKIDMQFLQDNFILCDVCNGQRYNSNTLKIKYKDKSIAEILNLSAYDALDFFQEVPSIASAIKILCDIGLGYIALGQPANSLSGGEAQRVKLAKELLNSNIQNSLYIFDEPTTGLHIDDINKLIKIFDMLIKNNNTLVIIEHNMNIISRADHIVDLGPKSGCHGGEIVAVGTPYEIANNFNTYTSKALKHFLSKDL